MDGISVFSNIFAEDTIAASAYNSFQASLEKRFSHGLQLQAAYTFSKSLDWASSFEETVNPFNYKAQPRALAVQLQRSASSSTTFGIFPSASTAACRAKCWMTGNSRGSSSCRAAFRSASRRKMTMS